MLEIVKVLLAEGIDEETIHEVLDVIEENYEIIDEKSGMDSLEGGIAKRNKRARKLGAGSTIDDEKAKTDKGRPHMYIGDERGVPSSYAPKNFRHLGRGVSHDESKQQVGADISWQRGRRGHGAPAGADFREGNYGERKEGTFENPIVKAMLRNLKKQNKSRKGYKAKYEELGRSANQNSAQIRDGREEVSYRETFGR